MGLIRLLIKTGLVVIPFLVVQGFDTRYPKELLATGLALVIALLTFSRGVKIKAGNAWLLVFIAYLIYNLAASPPYDLRLGTINISGVWNYKPLSYIFIYFLFYLAVSNACLTRRFVESSLNTISLCGLVMAFYCFLQFMRIDQFFILKPQELLGKTDMPWMAGTLGHPTIVAPFLAMTIPLLLHFRRHIFAFFVGLIVCLTKSEMAIGSMVVCLIIYFLIDRKGILILLGATLLIGAVWGWTEWLQNHNALKHFAEDNGRFSVWWQMWQDILQPLVPGGRNASFTGFGLGAYAYTFTLTHQSFFVQAHNDYMELLYNTGIIGLGLFLAALLTFAKQTCSKIEKDRMVLPMALSVLTICLCACGTFPFQLGCYQYYTVVLIGFLSNERLLCPKDGASKA